LCLFPLLQSSFRCPRVFSAAVLTYVSHLFMGRLEVVELCLYHGIPHSFLPHFLWFSTRFPPFSYCCEFFFFFFFISLRFMSSAINWLYDWLPSCSPGPPKPPFFFPFFNHPPSSLPATLSFPKLSAQDAGAQKTFFCVTLFFFGSPLAFLLCLASPSKLACVCLVNVDNLQALLFLVSVHSCPPSLGSLLCGRCPIGSFLLY